jgi:ABC-type glutathione transport system ATPase component
MRLMTVRGVRKSYRQGGLARGRTIRALDGVDLDIDAGRCLAGVGPSGKGKSTHGRSVVGL